MDHNTGLDEVLELLKADNSTPLVSALQVLMNAAMLFERQKALGATPYERSEERLGYANGFKPRTLNTRMGALQLKVPQTRGVEFYPSMLEKGQRSERALMAALAEMYVQGTSTRKVKAIVEAMCGFEVSSSQVSKATAEMDKVLGPWRERELGAVLFVYVDATYEKVRRNAIVEDAAILTAFGVDSEGKRRVLGVSVAVSEAEVHWRLFLESLAKRGLHGMKLIISDAHSGLKKALQAVFPNVPWQRCQFHLQQNAGAFAQRIEQRKEIASTLRRIFQAPDRAEAERQLKISIDSAQQTNPKLAGWMEENVAQGLTCFQFPEKIRRRIRTTNMVERNNRELKRRTRVASLFVSESSILRLVSALLMEQDEAWIGEKIYLDLREV
ncbi:MAG: IS256 family transposase [Spirochaetales bacterium]|nr:IS256 family transposase [Spirochaetales bacterium]